jgi:hypothetical protein
MVYLRFALLDRQMTPDYSVCVKCIGSYRTDAAPTQETPFSACDSDCAARRCERRIKDGLRGQDHRPFSSTSHFLLKPWSAPTPTPPRRSICLAQAAGPSGKSTSPSSVLSEGLSKAFWHSSQRNVALRSSAACGALGEEQESTFRCLDERWQAAGKSRRLCEEQKCAWTAVKVVGRLRLVV